MQPHVEQTCQIGTPDFSVPSLDALHQAGYNIVGIITAPDRKSGRGMKLQHSAVKKYALQTNGLSNGLMTHNCIMCTIIKVRVESNMTPR